MNDESTYKSAKPEIINLYVFTLKDIHVKETGLCALCEKKRSTSSNTTKSDTIKKP